VGDCGVHQHVRPRVQGQRFRQPVEEERQGFALLADFEALEAGAGVAFDFDGQLDRQAEGWAGLELLDVQAEQLGRRVVRPGLGA